MSVVEEYGGRRVGSRRDAIAVGAGIFVAAYGTNVSTPFLVLYRDRLDLGTSATQAIFVVYVAGILSTLLIIGPISDRVGRRAIVVPFVVLSGLASLVLVLGRNEYLFLLLGRFLLGVVSGAVLSTGAAWLQEVMGPGNEQRAAILTTVVTYSGFGIGPLSSALMAETLPGPLVLPFLVHVGITALVVPIVARVPDIVTARTRRPLRIELGAPRRDARTFYLVVVPAAVWVFAFPSTAFALLPVLLSEAITTSDVVVAGVVGTLTAAAGIFARPLVNRFGAPPMLPFGVLAGGSGYALGLIAFVTDVWPLVLPAAVLLGLASGAITTGCLTMLGSMADDDNRGAVTSTFYLLAYPGMAMPLILSAIASVSSFTAALSIVAAAATTSGLIQIVARSVRIGAARSS